MAARTIFSLAGLLFVAIGIVLQLFVILSGTPAGLPTTLVYFLQTSTNGIGGGAPNPARWTYFAICGADGDRNANCGGAQAALPFDLPSNFGTTQNVPGDFVGTNRYYLLSRFSWVFYLIALVFAALALLTGLLALCTRIGALFSGLNTILATAFQILAAALMTAWTVQARNILNANGQDASLGRYGYGFTWGSVFAFMVSTVLFCIGGAASGERRSSRRQRKEYA